ncbi:MAG: GHKL domain-containing protein [Clostridia bacterium]|nr:GHKL domain-containing protein [Clostridia bacterium]
MLREISLLWSMAHTLVLFILLFESRYSRKKTLIITLLTMIPLIIANTALAFILEAEHMGTAMLLTLSLPSLIVFLILAKNRDGRFLFTFCLVDTVVLEIIYVTQIINFYVTPDTNILMFVVRLLIFPIIEIIIYKKFRNMYLDVQRENRHGWGHFSVIGLMFYVIMTIMMNTPTAVTERPEYLPAMIIMFIIIPTVYINIVSTLRRQQKMFEATERENILRLQVHNMTARVDELAAADERFRQERHNLRHKMKIISNLVEKGQYDELKELMKQYDEALRETQIKRYCKNVIIDAVLSTYIQHAEEKGIRVEIGFDFPDPIPVDATELATVLANAIENAINACDLMPDDFDRFISVKVLSKPSFMIQVSNSFFGEIEFDDKDIPVNRAEGHGFGTRSIVAFCDKHNAFYQFIAKDSVFTLYLNF